ncbi:hypothetical protein [Pseudodesulfovibrio karagichevae]|uniref:Uncharacterized protein n=1 Tax=Pseudodesulfovibrio karagichevae TaxID=3239305 RepID=A0ABV4K9F4_9BACT
MSLSCSCDGSIYDYDWVYDGPSDFFPFKEHGEYKRRKRCASCGELIEFNAECVRYDRFRAPRSEYEENRFGSEVCISPIFHCEKCAEIYVTLWEIGYRCMSPDVPVREHLEEYWQITGFDPKKYE